MRYCRSRSSSAVVLGTEPCAHLGPCTGSGKAQKAPSSHQWLTVRPTEGVVSETELCTAWLHVEDVHTHTHMRLLFKDRKIICFQTFKEILFNH